MRLIGTIVLTVFLTLTQGMSEESESLLEKIRTVHITPYTGITFIEGEILAGPVFGLGAVARIEYNELPPIHYDPTIRFLRAAKTTPKQVETFTFTQTIVQSQLQARLVSMRYLFPMPFLSAFQPYAGGGFSFNMLRYSTLIEDVDPTQKTLLAALGFEEISQTSFTTLTELYGGAAWRFSETMALYAEAHTQMLNFETLSLILGFSWLL